VPDSSRVALEDFAAAWQDRYPAIIKLWRAQDGRWLFAERRLHDDWSGLVRPPSPAGRRKRSHCCADVRQRWPMPLRAD
jgi:hypothetical protein